MDVEIVTDLITRRAPGNVDTPWLTGRATRWQLAADYRVVIDEVEYVVPKGYVFDGSSIPWWLWAIYPPSYAPAWRAAAFHDRCYSHWYKDHLADGVWRYGLTKAFADAAFKSIMIEDGASPWVANAFHWAVSRFGKGGW